MGCARPFPRRVLAGSARGGRLGRDASAEDLDLARRSRAGSGQRWLETSETGDRRHREPAFSCKQNQQSDEAACTNFGIRTLKSKLAVGRHQTRYSDASVTQHIDERRIAIRTLYW